MSLVERQSILVARRDVFRSMQQSKKDLRRDMKVVISNLDSRWLTKAHAEVCGNITTLLESLRSERAVRRHVFAWIPCFSGEVDLAGVIDSLLKDSFVYIPRLDRLGEMSFVLIRNDWRAHVEPGPKGVTQPVEGYGEPFSDVSEHDDPIVLLPGLAFSQKGARLGRGAGHYDRFLAQPELARAIKIGVCWSMQVVRDIPSDTHDIRMDWIAHERGFLRVEQGMR